MVGLPILCNELSKVFLTKLLSPKGTKILQFLLQE